MNLHVAFIRGVRTFAQTLAGSYVGAAAIGDPGSLDTFLAALIAAIAAGLGAFGMNLKET